ncbi:MAG: DNA polymerase Y family protein [Polyangiaceae bacterium]
MHRSARRIAAISFSSLRIELARELDPFLERRPLAIVIARDKSSPTKQIADEASILGNTRLDEVSREAASYGILPGFTIAAARAKCADLSVRVVLEQAVEEALARISELALAFGATVSFSSKEDTVWADVTGCAHLHDARDLENGEKSLAEKLEERIRAQNHEASVAIADGPRVALAFARHARTARKTSSLRALVIPRSATKQAILALPISALPVDDAAKHWLSKLGLKSAADLAKLPRSSLGARLGSQSRDLFSFLEGADVSPLDPYRPPQTPVERVDLEYGIEGGEALLFVVKMLATRMSARLEGRALGATEVELTFELDDAARNRAKKKRSRVVRTIVLAAPIRNEVEIFSVLRARIEAAERRRETFEAPILAVELAATKLARMPSRELDLLSRETSSARALPLLIAELSADLGKEHVGILALENTHRSELRAKLVPVGEKKISMPLNDQEDCAEPSRFLSVPITANEIEIEPKSRLISRSAWIEWWKEDKDGEGSAHDWRAAWSPQIGATAWIDVDLASGKQIIRGWE